MTALYVVVGYLVYASLIGLIPATLARSKGRSFANWWAASVLLLGIFAVIPVMLMPTYRCPECREVVPPGAFVCSHCGTRLRVTTVASAVRPMSPSEARAALFFSAAILLPVVLVTNVLTCVVAFRVLSTAGAAGLCSGLVVASALMVLAVLAPPWRVASQAGMAEGPSRA